MQKYRRVFRMKTSQKAGLRANKKDDEQIEGSSEIVRKKNVKLL